MSAPDPQRPRPLALTALMVALLLAVAGAAGAQQSPSTSFTAAPYASVPLACDFKNAPVGSWAGYTVQVGNDAAGAISTRWAFLGRAAEGNTVEFTMEGKGPALTGLGGKVITRMLLAPDPVGMSSPIKRLIMQMGDGEPLQVPLQLPGLPGHKFQNPDPKKMVGKETITVPAGSFPTSHYREVWEESTVDAWISDKVPPLGLVKTVVTPTPGTTGPGGKPMPPVTMQLRAHGQGAQPAITRPARPFVLGQSEDP